MAGPTGCPTLISDGTYSQVISVMDGFWGNAQTAFNIAVAALGDLGSFHLHPINFTTGFDADTNWWHVRRPHDPERPDLTYSPDFGLIPSPPPINTGPDPDFEAPPEFTAQEPNTPVREGPGPLTAVPPDGPPDLDPIVMPVRDPITLPTIDELFAIVLPTPPVIQLPTFQGIRPNFNLSAPLNNFVFDVEDYSSTLTDAIRSKLQIMINGAPGLSAAAAAQMRDRFYSALDTNAAKAEQEVVEGFAVRGFKQPDGVLQRAILVVRQNNQNQRNAAARDVYLKDIDIAIEDLRFAVAQGIAIEGNLMQLFVQLSQMRLDAAKAAIQITIDIFNAEIALANLEVTQYQADAAVFRDLIQAELAKIELYKAEIDAQRLIGEINQQRVAIYEAKIRAVLALIEIYTADVNAAKVKSDINLARVQAFGVEVEAYATRVKAFDSEWDAFSKQVEADLTKYKKYELAAQVYQIREQVWAGINTNKIDQKKMRIAEAELDISAFSARLDAIKTVLTTETSRLQALTSVYGADIEKYRADAQIESVVSDAHGRTFALALEQEKERVQVALKNGELDLTQLIEAGKLIISKNSSIAATASQLAAGFASAMSVHAGISSSLSQSLGCSTQFEYQFRE